MATPTNPKPGPYDIGPFQEIVKLQWGEEPLVVVQGLAATQPNEWFSYTQLDAFYPGLYNTDPPSPGSTNQSFWVFKNDARDTEIFPGWQEYRDWLFERPIIYDPSGMITEEVNIKDFTFSGYERLETNRERYWYGRPPIDQRDTTFPESHPNVTFFNGLVEIEATTGALPNTFNEISLAQNNGIGSWTNPFAGVSFNYELRLKPEPPP